MTKISGLIKAKRESLGLSLREFAEKCNLSHSYIKNLEDGDPRTGRDITPTLSSLEKLAPVLGISIEDLLKEIGYINDLDERFIPSNLKLVRGNKTYQEISREISLKTGEKIEPDIYELLEKGKSKKPPGFLIDILARYANVHRSFFYKENNARSLTRDRINSFYAYESKKDEFPLFIKEDLREFVLNPANEEYIRLAKELSEKSIKVKLVRNTLFEKENNDS